MMNPLLHLTDGELLFLYREVYPKLKTLENKILLEEELDKRGMSFTRRDLNLAEVKGSGHEDWDEISLDEVLKHFKDFIIQKPIAYLTGGICNRGKTKGDLDILINKRRDEKDLDEDLRIEFRISRMFPEELRERLHFIYFEDDFPGPFTNAIPLYDLVMFKRDKFELSQMQEVVLKPFKWYRPPKTRGTYHKDEFFDLDALVKLGAKPYFLGKEKLAVEKKFDGIRVLIHKEGDEIKLYTEDKPREVTQRFVKSVKEMKKLLPTSVMLDAELVVYEKGKPLERKDITKWVTAKAVLDDEGAVFHAHDIVYINGEDIHTKPWDARWNLMKRVKDGKHLKKTKPIIVSNEAGLRRAVGTKRKLPGSEGAMIKPLKSDYPLTGAIDWMKFKNAKQLYVQVTDIHKVKGAVKTFNYGIAVKHKGELVDIGRTFNTNLVANIGTIVEVGFIKAFVTSDTPEKKKGGIFQPKVLTIMPDRKEPDSWADFVKIAKVGAAPLSSKQFSEERYSDGLIIFPPHGKLIVEGDKTAIVKDIKLEKYIGKPLLLISGKKANGIIVLKEPKEISLIEFRELASRHRISEKERIKWWPGKEKFYFYDFDIKEAFVPRPDVVYPIESKVIVNKKDIKIDLPEKKELSFKKRFVMQHHWRLKSLHTDLRLEMDGNLEGFTINDQIAGVVKEPVDTVQKGLAWEGRHKQISKLSDDPEDYKETRDGRLIVSPILAEAKAKQPKVWLKIHGRVEPGDVGATEHGPGIFVIHDSGNWEKGTWTEHFKEIWLRGRKYKGRFVVRLLPGGRRAEGVKKALIWQFWKPTGQEPYILTKRAIKKDRIPTGGESWLPEEWEKKIPKELRWWGKNLTKAQVKERIIKAQEVLKKEISEAGKGEKAFEETEFVTKGKFMIHRRYWRGQIAVRGMPVNQWDTYLDVGKESIYRFTGNKSPVEAEGKRVITVRESESNKDWLTRGIDERYEIKPNTKLNPNKRIPAYAEAEDYGNAEIIEENPDFISARLHGKKLKGIHVFIREDPAADIWFFEKTALPKPMTRIRFIKDADIYNPREQPDKRLVDDHRITHAWYSTIKSGKKFKYSLTKVIQVHNKIVKEMLKRKMKHNTPMSK